MEVLILLGLIYMLTPCPSIEMKEQMNEPTEEQVVITSAKIPEEAVNVDEVMSIAEVLTAVTELQKDKK